jgi:pyrroline-5-carboxylate reductase
MTAIPILAFVGGGHMATSLIGGLVARGTRAGSIIVAEPVAAQRERLQRSFGVRVVELGPEAVAAAETVVLAVKPQQMAEVARAIAPVIAERRPTIVSIAAGIRVDDLARWLGAGVPIVRTMPNRPALIGAGITALYARPEVPAEARRSAEDVMAACGHTVWVTDEGQLDAVTAVSGSGPAYFFLLMEALEAAAIEQGLDAATARQLAVATAFGAGRMAAECTDPPASLREQVTSRGGTTAAALAVLEGEGLRAMVARAVAAATRRSAELARDFGADPT